MFLKIITAIGLCASPLSAQEWQLTPASLVPPVPAEGWQGGIFDGLDDISSLPLGPMVLRSNGSMCIDIPGGSSACELNLKGEELMLIDREARGRVNVRLWFSIRP